MPIYSNIGSQKQAANQVTIEKSNPASKTTSKPTLTKLIEEQHISGYWAVEKQPVFAGCIAHGNSTVDDAVMKALSDLGDKIPQEHIGTLYTTLLAIKILTTAYSDD